MACRSFSPLLSPCQAAVCSGPVHSPCKGHTPPSHYPYTSSTGPSPHPYTHGTKLQRQCEGLPAASHSPERGSWDGQAGSTSQAPFLTPDHPDVGLCRGAMGDIVEVWYGEGV